MTTRPFFLAASLKRILGWLLTSVALLFLFVNSRPFDVNFHNQIVSKISALTRYDSELGEYVLKQHFHLLNNFDPLVAVSEHLQFELRELRDSDALQALNDEPHVMDEFRKMELRMVAKSDMLERFKSSHAVLRNSLLYLPNAMDDALHTLPPDVLKLTGVMLLRLREDVKRISNDPAAINLNQMKKDQVKFLRTIQSLPPASQMRLELLSRHFQQVTKLEKEASKLMRELTVSGEKKRISDDFARAYEDFYGREEIRAHRYLILLFVVALLMMTYATYAFYHMRRLNENTQRTLNELRNQKCAMDEHAIVSVSNVQGVITYVNQRFVNVSGYSRSELLGQNHRLINSGMHSPEIFQQMWRTIVNGKVWRGEIINRSKDGQLYWVDSVIVPFIDEKGKPYQYVAVRTDITAQKNLVQEASLDREAAEAANRAKGEFLAVMSHEIRTPMNGIIGMTELTLDTGLSSTQREYLTMVKSSADSLLVIINDILDFSKIESGKLALEQLPFDVHELFSTTGKILAVRAAQKNIIVSSLIDDKIPAMLIGDPGRLRQVLTNLLGNAIKFSHQGKVGLRTKLLELSADKIKLRIEVADQGIGIPPEMQISIFEAFTQADASTTRYYGGTGLGLAIAHQLVAAMGGELAVESEVGQGSVFSFEIELPVCGKQPAKTADNSTKTNAATQAEPMLSMNMLLAEDNAVNQMLAATLLARWGHRVTVANNGLEAVEISGEQAFDIILMDVQMPVMGGLEATHQIRQRENKLGLHTCIVAITANATKEDRQKCLDTGMDEYISKPIVADKLRAMLQAISSNYSHDRPAAQAMLEPVQIESTSSDYASFDYAAAISCADPNIVEAIGQDFLDNCEPQMAEIAAAIQAMDDAALARSAHTLRGLAAYFNATPVENMSRQLEKIASHLDWQLASNTDEMLRLELAALTLALTTHIEKNGR